MLGGVVKYSWSDLAERFLVEDLDLVTGPGRLAEEIEAGLEGRIVGETADPNPVGEFRPPVFLFQLDQHFFQFDAMKRVV